MKRFIDNLRKSKFFDDIMDNHEVILLYVAGLRLIDVEEGQNSYHLVAVVNETQESDAEEYLTCNGVEVRWSYVPLADFIMACGNDLQSYGAVLFGNIQPAQFVFANAEYSAVWQMLIANKKEISQRGAKVLLQRHRNTIERFATEGVAEGQEGMETILRLCVTSLFACDEVITAEIKDRLRELKGACWQQVSDSAKVWCRHRIKLLYQLQGECDKKSNADDNSFCLRPPILFDGRYENDRTANAYHGAVSITNTNDRALTCLIWYKQSGCDNIYEMGPYVVEAGATKRVNFCDEHSEGVLVRAQFLLYSQNVMENDVYAQIALGDYKGGYDFSTEEDFIEEKDVVASLADTEEYVPTESDGPFLLWRPQAISKRNN